MDLNLSDTHSIRCLCFILVNFFLLGVSDLLVLPLLNSGNYRLFIVVLVEIPYFKTLKRKILLDLIQGLSVIKSNLYASSSSAHSLKVVLLNFSANYVLAAREFLKVLCFKILRQVCYQKINQLWSIFGRLWSRRLHGWCERFLGLIYHNLRSSCWSLRYEVRHCIFSTRRVTGLSIKHFHLLHIWVIIKILWRGSTINKFCFHLVTVFNFRGLRGFSNWVVLQRLHLFSIIRLKIVVISRFKDSWLHLLLHFKKRINLFSAIIRFLHCLLILPVCYWRDLECGLEIVELQRLMFEDSTVCLIVVALSIC